MTPDETKKQNVELTNAHTNHNKELNSYAFYKTHNHNTGNDLVQDTFLKAWQYLKKGGKILLMKAFLYHILNNLIVDQYRKRKTTSLDVLIEKGFEPVIENITSIFNNSDSKAILSLIEHLPKKYRKIIHMRFVQELSLEEISKHTKQSKNTIAVQVHRGIAQLKKIYLAKQKINSLEMKD